MNIIRSLIVRTIYFSAILLTAGLSLSGCSNEDALIEDMYGDSDGIRFNAMIGSPDAMETRANNSLYNVTTEFYNCDFYVHIEGNNISNQPKSGSATYAIPAGYEGTIIAKDGVKPLNWFSRTNPHDFWAWTMPQQPGFDPNDDSVDLSAGITIEFPGSDMNETSSSSGSSWKDDDSVWKNGYRLEQLIGGNAGPYIYNDQGMYVPLRLRHLVSKILLKSFYVIDNVQGSTNTSLKGVITFYGLPSQATLYPTPRDAAGNALPPYVEMPPDWDYDPSSSIRYAITNSAKNLKWEGHNSGNYSQYYPRDVWYLPPEVDFSMLTFKIEIYEYVNNRWELSQTHGKHGAYYGNFRNITFSRSTNGTNYDDPVNPGSDATILHAGEYLELTINLQEKGNPTVQGNIIDWSTPTGDRTGSAHERQGIYSIEEMRELVDVMRGDDEELKKQYFELYGSNRDTGSDPEGMYPDYEEIYGKELEIFELFDDIGSEEAFSSTSSTTSKLGYYGNFADGYLLDGQGHTVNCNSSFVYIGPCRNVYFRYYYYYTYGGYPYPYYEYIVYVDNDGYVWLVDPATMEETPTGNNVLNPNKNPVTLYITSGNVS